MSPTAASDTTAGATPVLGTGAVGGGVYPGWCTDGWAGRVYWEGYTGTQPSAIPGLVIYSYLRLGPTHGQTKAISMFQ